MKTKILLLIMLASWLTSVGQIIHVPADQPTIQAGINVADNGDTVLVSEGVYFENITYYGKAITVASQFLLDADTNHILNTIIDGSQTSNPDTSSTVRFVSGEDTTSVLFGLTITGGQGISAMTWADSRLGGGIACYGSGAKIVHNRIISNSNTHETFAMGGGLGVWAGDTSGIWVVVESNVFLVNNCHATGDDSDWRSAAGGGMYLSANARIHDNYIQNNSCYSNFAADGGGIEVESYDYENPFFVELSDNIIQYNSGVGGLQPFGGGLSIYPVKMDIFNNKINYNTLMSDSYALGAGVNIFGDASDGDLIVFQDNEVIGNTIQGSGIYWGTAMNMSNVDHKLEIKNNIFEDNYVSATGISFGAVFIWVYTPEYAGHNAEYIFDGNTFKNNHNNYGGAIGIQNSFNFSLTNNVFLGNLADLGGAIYLEETNSKNGMPGSRAQETMSMISNNTFVNNDALMEGSAIYNIYLTETVATFNNIFWQNTSPGGSEIYMTATNPSPMPVYNSIIDTSKISGPWIGDNNFLEDPELEDDSIHITDGSPCFNTGIEGISYGDFSFLAPFNDFDGESRPMSGGFDIGADEYFVVGLRPIDREGQLSVTIHPNPFLQQTRISFDLESTEHCLLEVYNSSGIWIETLSDKIFERGHHELQWESTHLAGGFYYLRFTAGREKSTIIGLKMK